MERFPEEGVQAMILGNLSRELFDREISIIIPITILNHDFTDLLNNKVLYCDVVYKGLNHHEQHILEIFEGEFTTSNEDRIAKNRKYVYC